MPGFEILLTGFEEEISRELAHVARCRVCTCKGITCAFVMCLCKNRSLPAVSSPVKPHSIHTPLTTHSEGSRSGIIYIIGLATSSDLELSMLAVPL
jgi:hypothetical protein